MIAQIVKFKTSLSRDEALNIANERAPQFRAIPGLVQKYYLELDEPGWFSGCYIWESREAMTAFRQSDLAKTIPSAYKVEGAPEVTVADVMFPLRG